MRVTHRGYQNYALESDLVHAHGSGMKLYFNPLACSLASRIAIYERELSVELIAVDAAKQTSDGRNYRDIYPLGLVPALELADGSLLTENAAVLQFLAAAPADRQLQQWLSFISSELHVWLGTLLSKDASADVKAWALEEVLPRLAHVDRHLAGRSHLLAEYSVADGYLFAVLNWTAVLPQIDLATYPQLAAFHVRMHARPAVARAFAEERALYLAAQ